MADLDGSPVTADQLLQLGLAPYGHFTSIRVDNQLAKGVTLHMERLHRDARKVFGVELDTEHVRALARQAVADTSGPLVLRITVYDPATELGHPEDATDPHILITKRPASAEPPTPMRVAVATYERELPDIKHVSLMGTLRARRWAHGRGFDDVLFCAESGKITEGATWNIGFVSGKTVVWPAEGVLPGVTAALLDQAYGRTTKAHIYDADFEDFDAAFATNTTVGVRPITEINGVSFDAWHPTLKALQGAYAAVEPEAF